MSKKLAIAMFGQKRLSREGGVEIVVKELCTRMAQNGCDVTCYNRAGHHVSGAEYDAVSKIGQPSFQYAEGILSKWKEQGVRSMADVEQRDAEHQKRKKTASDQNAARKTAPAASSNRFNNFHQREYDYQKLEEQLLK